jgi:hypothetical protein
MPASVARGMSAASRPKKRVMSRRVRACTIPATGVRPPLLMLVAVRAMAPVAGMPPKSGEATLAMPCATSSMLDRWRPPIIPSATTADSSDSIAPSVAMVNAGPTRSRTSPSVSEGITGAGKAAEISPKRLPMVSTSRPSRWTAAVVTTRATKGEGTRWLTRGQSSTMPRVASVTPIAAGSTVCRCSA